MQSNVLNDLAGAMKALDGKKNNGAVARRIVVNPPDWMPVSKKLLELPPNEHHHIKFDLPYDVLTYLSLPKLKELLHGTVPAKTNFVVSITAPMPAIFFRPTPLGFRQVVQHVQLHVAWNR